MIRSFQVDHLVCHQRLLGIQNNEKAEKISSVHTFPLIEKMPIVERINMKEVKDNQIKALNVILKDTDKTKIIPQPKIEEMLLAVGFEPNIAKLEPRTRVSQCPRAGGKLGK